MKTNKSDHGAPNSAPTNQVNLCRCGAELPSVPDDETPFEFCSERCKVLEGHETADRIAKRLQKNAEKPSLVPHSQNGHSFTVDLNGNESLPVTKSGKVAVLRSHSIYVEHVRLTKRIFTQDQVKQVKQSGGYISQSDRDWTHRNKGRTVTLISPDELSSLTEQG